MTYQITPPLIAPWPLPDGPENRFTGGKPACRDEDFPSDVISNVRPSERVNPRIKRYKATVTGGNQRFETLESNRGWRRVTVQDETTTVAELIKLVDDFVADRRWEVFHDPKNLSCSIAIEAAELMEHFQWLRSDQLDAVRQDRRAMGQIREELADILAYMLSFASTMGIDLSSALVDKMEKNALKYPAKEFRGRFK
jgi:NTP pyrophosphatase (non-canonical NTP hydrolase)